MTNITTAPNQTNQTIWTSDNLDSKRGMNSETVDIIYLDQPSHMDAGSFSVSQRGDSATMLELLKIVVKILYIDTHEAMKLLKFAKGIA